MKPYRIYAVLRRTVSKSYEGWVPLKLSAQLSASFGQDFFSRNQVACIGRPCTLL